ncbi:MAG TPA: carboxypeptidase regulatory-like domain-containing protein [Chloroflexia bacterium]|nr:carboxypeptidase regulatory-like domain-containing protein [Chloroflexia bacterium]
MTHKAIWTSRLLGIGLGLAFVAAWLVIWRLALNVADMFSTVTLLAGLAAGLLSLWRPIKQNPTLRLASRTSLWIMAVLAAASALSLGAFLPPGLAEWISPVMGRFAGQFTLSMLGAGVAILSLLAQNKRPTLAVDAVVACSLASLWVGSQVPRQSTFPPPPTSASLIAARLDTLFVLCLILILASLGLYALNLWLTRRYVQRAIARRQALSGSNNSPGDIDFPGLYATLTAPLLLLRWVGLIALIGLAFSVVVSDLSWYRFALAGGLAAVGGTVGLLARRANDHAAGGKARHRGLGRTILRGVGWFAVGILGGLLLYLATSEDLEIVMLRNTVERQTFQFWRAVAGDRGLAPRPTGAMTGRVLHDGGNAIEGANIVVSEINGQVYSATSDLNGQYRLEGIPEGNYLPLSVAPGYRQATPYDRVVTVRPGQTAEVTFSLLPTQQLEIEADTQLTFGGQTTSSVDNPEPSTALRREFSYTRSGTTLPGGLVHEPPAEMGAGPFPILLIIFPGEARLWEGVTIPLASKGYVVVSYFPVRLLDMEGDIDDLMLLLKLTADGRLSERGDKNNIALLGGSVSTAYTYLMVRDMAGSDVQKQVKALVQYGGLFDFFQFRKDWEQGEIVVDIDISELEYLLVAFGRPDTRPELYLRLSPRFALGPGTLPPTLLVHSGNDIIVPANQSQLADETLDKWGIPHEYLFYPNSEHYLDTSKRDPTQVDMLNKTLAFLQRYIK